MAELLDETRLADESWLTNSDNVPSVEPRTYLTLELAGQIFAVDVADVREILDLQPISQLPNAPADLLGMIDVRGEAIAVVDLLSRLGLRGNRTPEESRIVVFEIGTNIRKPVGVIADRVLSVVAISDSDIEPSPESMTHWRAEAMTGITRIDGKLTMFLSLSHLFSAAASGPFDFD